ncbi:hypothetical protein PIROE2DRAFT_63389 [Piromyces sp. E2]|nr:hypothetical protein PIROE2DRAFT_63389 [Piromyces sp. E2]|eukprot:OUM60042.1 hypothetical protein PIROE2DRAFT_63389 [Piromyces sp. E2]
MTEESKKGINIIKEKKGILFYLQENYEVCIQYQKKLDKDYIFFQVKKENENVNNTYTKLMNYEDFEKLESLFLKLYDSIPKLFDFFLGCFYEHIISIKEINDAILTLIVTSTFIGFKDPVSLELNLEKHDHSSNEIIKILCEKIEKLEKENKDIKFQLENKILKNKEEREFIKNKLLEIPEFKNKNIIFKLLYRLSEDGSSITNFHRLCNNIKNNITLIKTTENERFGGFTQKAWTSSNSNIQDDQSFCFSISQKKIFNSEGSTTILDKSNTGPCFCKKLCIGNNDSLKLGTCNTENGTSNNLNSSFAFGPNSVSTFGNRGTGFGAFKNNNSSSTVNTYIINNNPPNFNVQEFEFYEVLFI